MKKEKRQNLPRIALCAIVKDDSELEQFDLCLSSFGEALSGLYVAVTGVSGKHSKIHELVKKHGGKSISTSPQSHSKIYSFVNDKWIFSNFAEARNVSFEMVDEVYDYLVWADTDDILTDWQELVRVAQVAKEEELDAVYFPYWYMVRTNEQGEIEQVIVEHLRERLLKPGVYKWVSRLHEVCVPIESNFNQKAMKYEFLPKEKRLLVWVHTAQLSESSPKIAGRNLDILKIQVEEENYKDPRTLFYLAKTYFDVGGHDEECIQLLTQYLTMSGWDAERANALEYLGLIYAKNGQYQRCVSIYLQAIQEYPKNHLSYLRLADAYMQLGQTEFSRHWLDVALRMDQPKADASISSLFEIKLLAATLQYNMAKLDNDIDKTLEWAKIRQDLIGKNDGLYDEVLKTKNLNTAAIGFFNLSKWLKDNGHAEKINPIIELLPADITNQPFMASMYRNVIPPRKWGKKEIAYYAVAGIEEWTSENLDKGGLGGSESAVARLSKEWTKLGYKVTVFNDCGSKAGVYDGVTYKPHYQMNWHDQFNILILWRNPGLLDLSIRAKKLYVDLHDICVQTDWTKARIDKVDKVFFKSKWHRNNLPNLPEHKTAVIGNGIVL